MTELAAASAVVVRPAEPADVGPLARFATRLFAETFGPDNRPEDMAAYLATAFTEERQTRDLADPSARVWIAEAAGAPEPAGYAHVRRGAAPQSVRARRPVEIVRFYVDHPWQGRGVARRLMEACLAQAAEWNRDGVWLGVWERNARAIAFYERAGFRKVGTQPFMLGTDVQTDWVMERAL